jgi:hypothetical protein
VQEKSRKQTVTSRLEEDEHSGVGFQQDFENPSLRVEKEAQQNLSVTLANKPILLLGKKEEEEVKRRDEGDSSPELDIEEERHEQAFS